MTIQKHLKTLYFMFLEKV